MYGKVDRYWEKELRKREEERKRHEKKHIKSDGNYLAISNEIIMLMNVTVNK